MMQSAQMSRVEVSEVQPAFEQLPPRSTRKSTYMWLLPLGEGVADLLTVCLSLVVSYAIYRVLGIGVQARYSVTEFAAGSLLFALIVVFVLDRNGAYKSAGGLLRIRETACALKSCVHSFFLVMPLAFFAGRNLTRWFSGIELIVLMVMLVVEKQLMHSALDALRRHGYGRRRVIIYGAGSDGRALYSALTRSPKLGFWPVAIIDAGSGSAGVKVHASSYRRTQFLTIAPDAFQASLIRRHEADVVIVASPNIPRERLQVLVEETAKAGAALAFTTGAGFEQASTMDYVDLDGLLIFSAAFPQRRYWHEAAMRVVDVACCGLMTLLLGPLMLILAMWIRLDSPGPALFRQQRVGKDGRLFTIYKFRSMRTDLCSDRVSPDSSEDPRITRAGRWLRKTSLDELPQLLNVLKNDMALVGPRPEMPFIVAGYSPEQRQRLAVKPGLTGLWQISADRRFPIHENIHYDLYYLKHRNVFMDIAILLHTVVFASRGV